MDSDLDGLGDSTEIALGTNPYNPDYKLTVTKSGTGDGTISRSPAGIDYGSSQYIYASGTPVALTATPDAGSIFTGWSGCDSANGNQCTVTMDAAKNVTATFALTAPPAPTLAQPTSGATEVDINPIFSWIASAGADSYQLQVSTDPLFGTTVFNRSGLTATSQTVNGLLNGKTYYWRVNATNSVGTTVGRRSGALRLLRSAPLQECLQILLL